MRCAPILGLILLFTAAPAAAQDEGPRRLVVDGFDGPNGPTVRNQVVQALMRADGVELVPRDQMERAARRVGAPTDPWARRPEDYAAISRDLGVSAYVSGSVSHAGGWRVTVRVRDGGTGEVVEQTRFAARRARTVSRAMRTRLWRRIGPSIRRSTPVEGVSASEYRAMVDEAPPPPNLSQDDVEQGRIARLDPELLGRDEGEEAEAPEAPPGPPFEAEHAPFEVSAGLRALNRAVRYQGEDTGTLRPYDLPVGPEATLAAEWYPGAHVTNGALAHLGVAFRLDHSFLMESAGPNEVRYPTSNVYWSLGARYRIPLGESRITLDLGFARHSFTVERAHPRDPAPEIANVGYDTGRVGAGTRIAVGDVRLMLGGAYLHVLGEGELGEDHWFPRATTQGFEAMIGFGYPLEAGLELRGTVDGRVYSSRFDPQPGDAYPAEGALDRFVGASMGLAWGMDPTGL